MSAVSFGNTLGSALRLTMNLMVIVQIIELINSTPSDGRYEGPALPSGNNGRRIGLHSGPCYLTVYFFHIFALFYLVCSYNLPYMKRIVCIAVCIILFFSCVRCKSESRYLTVELSETAYSILNQNWILSSTIEKWPSDEHLQLDSILFKAGFFNVLVSVNDTQTVYSISKNHNSSLTEDYTYVFPSDSLRIWRMTDTAPNIYVCDYLNNGEVWSYFFRPFTPMNYNDARVNEFPLVSQGIRVKIAVIDNRKFEISQNDDKSQVIYIQPCDKRTERTGNPFKDKHIYSLKDTIAVNDGYFRADSIDRQWSRLYVTSIDSIPDKYIPIAVRQGLEPYMNDNSLLLLDFWATWCNPCIQSMPKLKSVYNEISHLCTVVGICYDKPTHKDRVETIIRELEIPWPQIFDEEDAAGKTEQSFTAQLNIQSFPTYLLINSNGKIILQASGTNGLNAITDYLESINDIH